MPSEPAKSRREKGSGGLRFRADKNLWEATVDLGSRPVYDTHGYPVLDASGKQKVRRERRIIYGKTEAAALKKKQGMERDGGAMGADITIADFLARYRAHKERTIRAQSPRGYEAIEGNIRVHLIPHLGHLRLAKLTADDVERMVETIGKTGKIRTAIVSRNTLRAALNWGIKQGVVDRNAAGLADVPEARAKPRRTLTEDEARKIIAHPDRLRALWTLGLATGMRMSELLGLHWEDIDLANGIVHVQKQLTRAKGEEPRRRDTKTDGSAADVLLASFAVEALREHQRRTGRIGGYVFQTSNATPFSRNNLHRMWGRLLRDLKIPYVNFHAATRHTCATMLFGAGVDMRIIQSVLRHARIGTTSDIYTHLTVASQKTAADAMERLLGGER